MILQNDISAGYSKDKATNIQDVLDEVSKESGFVCGDLMSESKWWNSIQVGAKHFNGTINNKPAVLKLQLVKVNSPEVKII